MSNKVILITGSSGFVASELVPLASTAHQLVGIDIEASKYTDVVAPISAHNERGNLVDFSVAGVVHLAAARFDHGAAPTDYYVQNVTETEVFLERLNPSSLDFFVHISSVAALDGKQIQFSTMLGCDDAYRSTKYLQECVVREWAAEHDISLYVLYPSAIFTPHARADTNIGKLQAMVRYLPFIPAISSKKSLTFLPSFACFIVRCMEGSLKPGSYLTIERPVLSVSEILAALSPRPKKEIRIPGLKGVLLFVSWVLWIAGGFGSLDLRLTPNRVRKLFSDTDYKDINEVIDVLSYNEGSDELSEILKGVTQK